MDPRVALEPLPSPYRRHYDRILEVAEPDDRIRGLWLSGSLARGSADAGSDLDLLFAIKDEDFDDFIDGWRDWLAQIAPLLIAKQIPRSKLIFTATTEDMCRIDGVVEPVDRVSESPHRTRIPVIDRDGLTSLIADPEPLPGPDLGKITGLIEEFWRIEAISPAMINDRQDLLCALAGVHAAGQLLYDVFVESNQPMPPMGVKQFTSRLRPEQAKVLLELPAAGPERKLLIAAHLAVCDAMDTAGRRSAERVGASYPETTATAVVEHLRNTLTV